MAPSHSVTLVWLVADKIKASTWSLGTVPSSLVRPPWWPCTYTRLSRLVWRTDPISCWSQPAYAFPFSSRDPGFVLRIPIRRVGTLLCRGVVKRCLFWLEGRSDHWRSRRRLAGGAILPSGIGRASLLPCVRTSSQPGRYLRFAMPSRRLPSRLRSCI